TIRSAACWPRSWKPRSPPRWPAARTNRHSPHPDHGGGEVDEAEEVDGEPVVAGGEAAEVLELCEAALDAVAQPVEVAVVRDGGLARAGRGDDGLGADGVDPVS